MLGLELLWRRVGVRRYWRDATIREAHHHVDDAGLEVLVPRQRTEAGVVSLEEAVPAVALVAEPVVDVTEPVVDVTEPVVDVTAPVVDVTDPTDANAITRLRRGDATV